MVVLGHGFWQRRFGGDAHALGKRLEVSGAGLTIVGVAPPGLRIGLSEPDIYTPLPIDPAKPDATGSGILPVLRPVEARDLPRHGAVGNGGHRVGARAALPARRRIWGRRLDAPRLPRGRRPLRAAAPHGRRRGRAPHRLREPRRLADGARARTPGPSWPCGCRSGPVAGGSCGNSNRSLTLASLGGVAALVVASWATRALVALAAGC